jgi:hypothetical protein
MDDHLAIGNSGGDCRRCHCALRQAIATAISLYALVCCIGAINVAGSADGTMDVSAD